MIKYDFLPASMTEISRFVSGVACCKAVVVFLLLVFVVSAHGVVLHNDSQPTDRPDDSVAGRWNSNGSCVAIGPDMVISTMHQGTYVGSTVRIDGVSYLVSECYETENDFCISRLTSGGQAADLSNWVGMTFDVASASEFVIGGYGQSRGAELSSASGVYGYTWRSESNSTLRWGTNTIDSIQNETLRADFDGPLADGVTEFEAAIGLFDSGSGWFVNEGGQWKLCGLSQGVEHSGESIFATEQGSPDADRLIAIDLASYSTWITALMNDLMPVAGDADRDGDVDYEDLAILAAHYGQVSDAGWSCGNFDGDGDIDLVDLGLLSMQYGYGVSDAELAGNMDFSADLATVLLPEPSSAILMLMGAAALLRRR